MVSTLEQLEQQRLIWRGREANRPTQARPSGWAELDQHLGGWPGAGVTSIHARTGVGELRLLFPCLQQAARLSVFIAPPYSLNAESLEGSGLDLEQVLVLHPESPQSRLWAAEQSLKSGACHTVCLWPAQPLQIVQARRLQLAARAGDASLFLLTGSQPGARQDTGLPLDLCLELTPHSRGVMVAVPRRRHGWALPPFLVSMESAWPELTSSAVQPTANRSTRWRTAEGQ
ncbi:translesion DNA synthesis-associated protein ImuA [Marinimicrobium agarilyticum]|uniref:translesion DNA synthesis-associated protein ImuA n=1 Tax=Marinimicrobium agarilyticum TaxID=306546 RepID=UPI000420476C|nr:translesion DNA synthesis-associated protein ImuA [Marinimicrobium agarilyticum]